MSDVMSKEQRRRCMSAIKGTNTKPEKQLRKVLWAKGLRYRLNYKLPGKPDIVFPNIRLAIFVDGCFWHGCPEHFQFPKNNAEFWHSKIMGNVERDRRVNQTLNENGWNVFRVWEHEIEKALGETVDRIIKCILTLKSNHDFKC